MDFARVHRTIHMRGATAFGLVRAAMCGIGGSVSLAAAQNIGISTSTAEKDCRAVELARLR